MIGGLAKTVFGRVFIRPTASDYDDFDPTILETAFETAFPTATTEYKDGTGAVEYTEAPEGGYDSANGDLIQPISNFPGELKITGLDQAAIKTFVDAHVGKQVDVCIKNDDEGTAGLGGGVVFRNVNLWGGRGMTIEGVEMYSVQWQKKYPAVTQYKKIQRFEIAAT